MGRTKFCTEEDSSKSMRWTSVNFCQLSTLKMLRTRTRRWWWYRSQSCNLKAEMWQFLSHLIVTSTSSILLWDIPTILHLLPQSLLYGLLPTRFDLFVGNILVISQASPGRKGFVAEVTWNTYSFQVFGLNVIYYCSPASFFSTRFANAWCFLLECPICVFTIGDHLLAFLHHWLDFLIKR